MARHQPDTVPSHAVPQPETSVGGPGTHIVTVGVEGETVDVREMTVEDPERLALVCSPESGRPVVATGGEIVTVRSEGAVPDWEHVALVAHQAGPGQQGPQSHRPVLGTREEQRPVRVNGEPVHRATVAHQGLALLSGGVVHHPVQNIVRLPEHNR